MVANMLDVAFAQATLSSNLRLKFFKASSPAPHLNSFIVEPSSLSCSIAKYPSFIFAIPPFTFLKSQMSNPFSSLTLL